MRHSIKRISKSALSVILALMMVVSTMAVGIVTFNAATTYYYRGSDNSWGATAMTESTDGYYAYIKSSNSANQFKISTSTSSYDYNYSYVTKNFNSTDISNIGDYSSDNCYCWYSGGEYYILVYYPNTSINTTDKPIICASTTLPNNGGSSGGDDPTAVTGDLLSVLNGTKVMFYGGERVDWNNSTFHVMYTNSTSDAAASGTMSGTYTFGSSTTQHEFAAFCLPEATYYMGHWASGLSTKVSAGAAYVVRGSTTSSEFSQIAVNGSNYLYSVDAGATLTATTTCDPEIKGGSTLTVNTSSSAGTSTIGNRNSFEYYIGDSEGNYYKYTLTGGSLDTSSLADGTYTLKTVLTDGTIYVVGDTDTFTVSSKTDLAKPDVVVSNSNVVTSKANATITVTSSGDTYPSGTTYKLLDASDNEVSGVTWNGNVATVEFADLSSADANYKVKVSADEATYNPAVSDEFNLKKVQLYAITLATNDDAVVTGTYTDAYGVSGKTIAEGETADVPSGYTVHVNATGIDTANKVFNKFTYNGSDYSVNPYDIPITADGTISTVIDSVSYRTVKIAVIRYADKYNHSETSSNYLGTDNVTYTFGGSTQTATMTAVEEDPTAYFAISGYWSGNGHKFYIYEVSVPSTVTSISVDGKVTLSLDETTEYYGVYHYDSWKSINFMTSDRYYYVQVVADTTVDSGATVSATGSDSVAYNEQTTRTLYKYQSTITLTATPSNASAFSLEKWNDGTSDITSPYTVVGDATLTAYFKANQTYAINLVDTDANLSSITSSPATATYESNTVKVTVTPKTGYECTGLTVTGDSTSTSVSVTDNGDGTYSFTMPGEAVTVTPTISEKPEYTYALVGGGDTGSITDTTGQAAAWNGAEDGTLNQSAFDAASSLKFTNNKLVVTAVANAQFRFIGTDGSNYYHYGSANESNETISYGTTYNTTLDDKKVYQFSEAGTFEIEITSGTESPMSFKVTKLADYYVVGRFAIKNADGTYTSTSSTSLSSKPSDNFWDKTSTNIRFSYDSDSIYKLNTGLTVSELTVTSNYWYFRIYDGTTTYTPSENIVLKASNANTRYTPGITADRSYYFNDSDESGIVVLCFDASAKQFYFEIESGKTPLDAPSITSDRNSLTASNPTATITVTPASYPEGVDVEYYLYNGGTYVTKSSGTTFAVSSAGTYTVKAYPSADNAEYKESVDSNSVTIEDGRTPVIVKAMNGVSTLTDLGTTVAEAANTSSSVVEDTSANLTNGIQYNVTKGSTVKVTTTMAADTTTAEKFVYAYVVNYKDTYLATEGVAATGEDGTTKYATYSATFTIDEDATDTTFTVYPIYYYKACANDGEYIKFYVNTRYSSWTKIYNYAYYYGDTTQKSDGDWPGQPMLYDETKQLYYSLVPKEIKGQTVSGLTVNNDGSEQTYDFDDFKYIYESGYDIVRLDLKYRSGNGSTTSDSGNGVNKIAIGAGQTESGDFADPSKTITVSTFADRWEDFNDINGNPMSLLGKEVTDTTNKVYVVSTALYNISDRGEFMTSWYVYKSDSSGNLTFVTAACPSDFVPRPYSGTQTEEGVNTTAYNAILDAGLGNAPVQIVFEDVQFKSSKDRFDGRWYYAQSDSEVSAYAYYRTSADGTTYSELKQDAAYASVDGAVSITNPKLGLEISVVSSPLAGYIFSHWSVADNSGNIVIEKLDNVGASFTTTLDQEMHYVANFVEAAEGSLVINHGKYVGSDAKGGLGYYRIEVQVYRNGAWTDITTGTGTGANGQSVTIDVDSATDTYIRIKLITETAGENTFRYWYTTSSDGTEIIEDPDGDMTCNGSAITEPTGLSGTLTYTFETEVWKLFRDNKQIISQMNFYSDIAPMTKNYKLTYIYDDRFGNQKSYVVTGTHDDQYYVDNGTWAPNEALIYEKAPYIDDLYKDCTWTMTQCTQDGTDATLIAVQNNKKYTVDIYDSTGEACDTYQLAINSYVKNNAGQFYVADATNAADEEFSYWVVYERIVAADGTTVTKGKEVARLYSRKYTLVVLDNYWIEPVYGAAKEDKAYISDPQYTREQSTNADGTVVTDTLYVDFMLAYMSSTGALISSDPTGTTYKTGVLVELGQNYVLPTDENGVVTDTDYTKITFTSSSDSKLEEATSLDNGKSMVYNFGTSESKDYRRIYNFTANNSDYNNMNRLDYFVAFKNSDANRKYVMKAYYYVIVGDQVIISEPVYFNLYDVGISDPNTDV